MTDEDGGRARGGREVQSRVDVAGLITSPADRNVLRKYLLTVPGERQISD